MTSPWRKVFPVFRSHDVAYLDHAATCQMPDAVFQAMIDYETSGRANAGRGLYPWSARATEAFAVARSRVAAFVGARPERLIFTRGATDGLNMVAQSLAERLGPGDEVLVTLADHHASLLPWRVLAKRRGFSVRTVPLGEAAAFSLDVFREFVGPQTKVVAVPMVSNVLGNVFPVVDIVQIARRVSAFVVVDAAQAVGHLPVDIVQLGCDALAFSAHKMYGPTGIGALALSDRMWVGMEPTIFGGGMVDSAEELSWRDGVARFEAGTQDVAGAVGFAAAAEWLAAIGWEAVRAHEAWLTEELLVRLKTLPVSLLDPSDIGDRIGIVSFTLDGIHAHDVAEILGRRNVCVRAGHHCVEPLAKALSPAGSVRVSLGLPNDGGDIERLIDGLQEAQRVFGYV